MACCFGEFQTQKKTRDVGCFNWFLESVDVMTPSVAIPL
jgi:hypothetical protein